MSAHPAPSISAENLRRIRGALPAAAFRPAPDKLAWMALHALVVVAAHLWVSRVGLSGWLVLPILLATVSLPCIGFHTHDLAHGSILRPGRVQRACELFFWSLLLMAPTIWRRVHNQAHHVHYNTPQDPDRPFVTHEACAATRWYTRLLYPNDEMIPGNPLVFVHFAPYVVRNTVAALLPARWKPAIVPSRPAYDGRDTAIILGELLLIAVVQAGLFLASGGRFLPYLIMLAGSQALTSGITMAYIFTNHFLNPLTDEPDPIQGTTSVIVPAWLDRLHANFSYHTEHHLLPGLNSDYYPALSQVLAEIYPRTYRRIPIGEAWRQLWQNEPFAALVPRAEAAAAQAGSRS